MNPNNPRIVILSLTLVILASTASTRVFAQRGGRDPHLAYAYPAGCQRGTSCELTVGGQHLKEATEAYVAGEGVEVEILGWYRPMTQGEYNNLNMKMREVREKLIEERSAKGLPKPSAAEVALAAGVTDEQLKEMEIYRQRSRDPKRQPNAQLEEEVKIKFTVADDAEPGKRELRFMTQSAMSNPLWLHIGQWPELYENEPNDTEPNEGIEVLPVVINGQIMPGDVDRFSFDARQGMKVVIEVGARDVIPYLADAVPGWFQAIMRLIDSEGNEVSVADSFHYRQDPVLYFEVPRDDRYTIEVRDSIYRGREDFVYRIKVGEIPFITGIFPLGARVDSETSVELFGWNLTRNVMGIKTMTRRQYRPKRWYTTQQGDGVSIRFPMQIDYWPEVTDQEPNNDIATAQSVSTRQTINGRINEPGDKDVFVLESGGGIVAEVHARRLGSPLDSMLTLTDEHGNEVAYNDDHIDKAQAMQTHHADSHLTASLPAGRKHYLQITDAQNNGGRDFAYRLCLRPKQADFELRVTPSSIIARAGQIVPITVFALRQDGFDEDITLSLVDPPDGFRLDGNFVPGEAEKVRMTLQVPSTAPSEPLILEMEGTAPKRIRSRSMIVRPAVPAEHMMQAFIWYHLVPVERWTVVVSGKPGARIPFQVVMPQPQITLPRGGEFLLGVMPLAKKIEADQLQVEISEPPPGISAEIKTDPSGAFAIQINTVEEEVEAGLRSNLIIRVFKEYTPAPTEANPNPRPRRTDYGYLPAIPFEVSDRKARK